MECDSKIDNTLMELLETQSKVANKGVVRTKDDGYESLTKSEEIYMLKMQNLKLMKENLRLKKLMQLIKDECLKITEVTK